MPDSQMGTMAPTMHSRTEGAKVGTGFLLGPWHEMAIEEQRRRPGFYRDSSAGWLSENKGSGSPEELGPEAEPWNRMS